MEKIKPEVAHYIKISCGGKAWYTGIPWAKSDLAKISSFDLDDYGIKTKWRPVYKNKVK